MFKKIFTALLLASVLLLTSCNILGSAKLATNEELMRYCIENFGPCELIKVEKTKNMKTIYVRDIEKGFEYHAISNLAESGLDVSFGKYEEKLRNFDTVYIKDFYNKNLDFINQLSDSYGIRCEEPQNLNLLIYGNDLESSTKAAQELIKKAREYDTRYFWEDIVVPIYIDNNCVGRYSEQNGFIEKSY